MSNPVVPSTGDGRSKMPGSAASGSNQSNASRSEQTAGSKRSSEYKAVIASLQAKLEEKNRPSEVRLFRLFLLF